jgi:hypothetical protein
MVEKIKISDVEEVLTIFCRNIIDKYTLNLEKVKSIEILATDSDTDSERDQSERIYYQAKIRIDFNKLIQDLPSNNVVKKLVRLFNNKFHFTEKQKENNFVRMKSRMINILKKIKRIETLLEIEESTSISEIKKKMTQKLVKIFIDNGIVEQLKNSIDELRPYKKIGIIFSLIFVLLILYKLIIFIIRLYQKYNLPKIKNDNINSHIFF